MQTDGSPFLPGSLDIVPCGTACPTLSLLQQIYHTAPVGMAAIAKDLTFVRMNSRLAGFLGYSLSDCLGSNISHIAPEMGEQLGEIVNGVFLTEKQVVDKEIYFEHDSEINYWLVNAYPILDEDNVIENVNLIILDITELRNVQINLETAYEDISKLQEKLKQENQYLKLEISKEQNYGEIIGKSPKLSKILDQAFQVAVTDTTVLISGDTGTGKELLARAIHQHSPRKDRALVTVNCAALPANLIESELFGHEKGAFTGAINKKPGRFEIADKGTIFLDEIGELPLELQSKLLRVLQEGQIERLGGTKLIDIDVRVIAATNRDLAKEVKDGNFREDLFFRLNVFPLHLPSLSERKEDIPEIATNFVSKISKRMGKKITEISSESIDHLKNYEWPGNIRELRNIIERAVILCKTSKLEVEIPTNPFASTSSEQKDSDATDSLSLSEIEKAHILKILEKTNWRIRGTEGAAQLLDLKPTTLESRMLKLGIKRKK